jgi:hypothetical protein
MAKLNNSPHSAAKPFFRAAVQSDGTLEMPVYEEIGENYWTGGGVTAESVKQQMDDAGPYSKNCDAHQFPGRRCL